MNNAKLIKELMPEMYERAVQGKCPFCGKTVTTKDFEGLNEIYTREFKISGICPTCQDNFFK
jgi:predicted RNA-binding Zn-ribbon protein involved in translation (DUF1610 family)